MREEWSAELDAYPGGIWGLWWAMDLSRVANSLAPTSAKQDVQRNRMAKTVVRVAGTGVGRQIGRSLLRGILGSILR